MTSPIRIAGAALVAGAVAGRFGAPCPSGAAAAVASVAAAAAAVLLRGRRRWIAVGAILAAAATWVAAAAPLPSGLALPSLEVAELEAVVVAGPDPVPPRPGDDPSRRPVRLRMSADGVAVRVVADARADPGAADLLPGDRVRLVGRVRARAGTTHPGRDLDGPGAAPVLDVAAERVERLPAAGPGGPVDALRRAAERLRRVVRDRLRDACGGEIRAYGVLLCLVTGSRDALPADVGRAFRDSGTAHLLAVSGLHLVLLVAVARAAARRAVPETWRRCAGLPATCALVLLYAAVCRFETPVVRAAVFLLVGACARAVRRRTSTLDHLALAAGIVVAADPSQVADVGFQLSFAAVAGIALLTARLRGALFPNLALLERFPEAMPRRRLRLLRGFANGLSTTLAAQVATAPSVAQAFGAAQPAGPLANLVAVPLFGAVLPAAVALAAAGGAAPALTAPVADATTWLFVAVADAGASVPFGHVALGRPPPWVLAAGLALLAAAVVHRPWTRPALLLPGAAWAAFALGPAAVPRDAAAEVVCLDVGHGLSVLVRSSSGTALLYDAGGRALGVGERTVVPALRALGVRRLAALCLSHEDADHCGAAEDVLREVDVDRVVVPAGFGASPLGAGVVEACRRAGVPVEHAIAGDELRAEGLRAAVLHPAERAAHGAENGESLTLHVDLDRGALTVLLPGDLDGEALESLAGRPSLPAARVLLLPHHGRGDAAVHRRLAARTGADALVASASDPGTVVVAGAWVTGVCGSVRVRAGRPAEPFPW